MPFSTLAIRHIRPTNPFVLAPLDGYTDLPFRLACRRAGAGLCFTEMVPGMALAMGSRDSRRRMRNTPEDHPLVIQVAGPSPDLLARCARLAEEAGADAVDVNAGCPSRTVTNGGAGAALLSDLPLLARILTAVRRAVQVPVTVKVRSGPVAANIVIDEIARIARDTGMDAVTLHARTRAQGYSGRADWTHIARFKSLFEGTVIGNGDVTSASDGLRMLAETGCDGVMVGRAAIGDPWIFTALDAAWRGLAPPPRPVGHEFLRAVLGHFDELVEYLGDEEVAARLFRKHLCRYVRGLSGAVRLRRSLPEVTTRRALCRALEEVVFPTGSEAAAATSAVHPSDFSDIEVPA